MAEILVADSLKDLQSLIDQQHLVYLELDESPKKIDQRDKLEGYIKEYLCIAPHDAKFSFHQTANVLHQSASAKNNFSAYKAAVAWKAIGKYADNLISHPWRKEYRDIKMYCGFYKHEIEESLVGAELMFEAMGYRNVGQSSMALPGILDPDRITSVSKDAIVAFVECQIMKRIWETLSSHFNITWLEILEFRENHIGTPDQVIRALTYKYRQRQYQEQIYHKPHVQTINNHICQQECSYGQHSVGYYNHVLHPGYPYSAPAQTRYSPVISPQQMMPPPYYSTPVHPTYASSYHILKPQEFYPVNGYQMHPHYSPQVGLQNASHNGYSIVPMVYPVPSIVPTGQLIELDSSPTHNGTQIYSGRSSNVKYNPSQEEVMHLENHLKNDGPSISSKAKNDGAGSWENWDYVYRNLESQRHKKENESLGDILFNENQLSSSQNNSSDIDSMIHTDFTDKLSKMNLDSNNQSQNETYSGNSSADMNEDSKGRSIRDKTKADSEIYKEQGKVKLESKNNKISPNKETLKKNSEFSSLGNSTFSKVGLKKENDQPSTSKDITRSRKSREEMKPLIVNLDDTMEKWQCVTCTYLNSISSTVCEMCCKSRKRGSELNPQPSGGAECPKCTLVNEPGLTNCAACSSSLKDSPTYI